MLYQSHEIVAQQRATSRWKEWIPLISQQVDLSSDRMNFYMSSLCDIIYVLVSAPASKSNTDHRL